jgi:hypothetical protein
MHIQITTAGCAPERLAWSDFVAANVDGFEPDDIAAMAERLQRGETVSVVGGYAPLVILTRAVPRPFPLSSII